MSEFDCQPCEGKGEVLACGAGEFVCNQGCDSLDKCVRGAVWVTCVDCDGSGAARRPVQ
ncbi:MAG TPA: hypothetical protein VGS22_16405 [Thermoanaerobaculia bacterium]|jgi:hypothetical protein|nr:hypothetical protein [Thermoanaerobaculia bacterium]